MRRRAVYLLENAAGVLPIRQPVFAFLKERLVTDEQAQKWIRRELEALLMIDDVEFLADLVTHVVRDACKQEVERKLHLAIEPFLHEHAGLFAAELGSFLASGLNMVGYDHQRLVGEENSP